MAILRQVLNFIIYDLIFLGVGVLLWRLMNFLGKQIQILFNKFKGN